MNEAQNTVTLSWAAPSSNGSPITRYTIVIRQDDLQTYSENLVDCDGSTS